MTRNAYNFIPGKFGDSNRELICVQTEDGLLQFCDLNKIILSIQLEKFIIPGPIEYIPGVDCICVQNSCYEIEAYKYATIFAKNANPSTDKTLTPAWRTLIGETAMSFNKYETSAGYVLVAACEHHIFILTGQQGILRSIKKLLCVPSYFVINNNGPVPHLNFILSSFSHHLLFYKDFDLVWASKTNHVAHGIKLGNFGGQKGLLVLLNEEGYLEICYLGTEPPKNAIPNLESREQTYDDLNTKLAEVNGRLEVAGGKGGETDAFKETKGNL
jgi:Bardet-Biedl syndrome 9 protein